MDDRRLVRELMQHDMVAGKLGGRGRKKSAAGLDLFKQLAGGKQPQQQEAVKKEKVRGRTRFCLCVCVGGGGGRRGEHVMAPPSPGVHQAGWAWCSTVLTEKMLHNAKLTLRYSGHDITLGTGTV